MAAGGLNLNQRGLILVMTLVILSLLTALAVGYCMESMWLKRLGHQVTTAYRIHHAAEQLIDDLSQEFMPTVKCLQPSISVAWFDRWTLERWQTVTRCQRQINDIDMEFLIERMPTEGTYFIWGLTDLSDQLQRIPVAFDRLTLLAKYRGKPSQLIEICLAKPNHEQPSDVRLTHSISLGIQSKRQRSVWTPS